MSTQTAREQIVSVVKNEHHELASPDVWVRIRKFMYDDVTIRDFKTTTADIVARVIEVNGEIESVSLTTMDKLDSVFDKETTVKDRPWTDNGTGKASSWEVGFGVSPDNQYLVMTPAHYFSKTGELWPLPKAIDSEFLPDWLDEITAGVFKHNAADINQVKDYLLVRGFIEIDELTNNYTYLLGSSHLDSCGVPIN